jgi:formate hydrogenlyase transcriptional activator
MDAHSNPEQLIRSLPSELSNLVVSNTAALVFSKEIAIPGYIYDNEGLAIIPEPQRESWQDEICQVISEQPHPFVVSSLDRETRFDAAVQLFRERGNQSLCVLPLHTAVRRLGTLCFARGARDAFSKNEIDLLSLIADYVALAIDDRLNFAHSETVRTQLESERKKLQLILDLNNSVVSNLELREVLKSVSPGIRKIMRLDGVALILPDAANKQLQLFALDFPESKGLAYQNMSRPLDGSLAGQVFRTGKPWVGNIEDLNGSGFGYWVISG